METKDIKDLVDGGFKDLEGKVDAKFQTQFDAKKAEIVKEIEEKGFLGKEAIDTLIKEKTAELDTAVMELKKKGISAKSQGDKSFKDYLGEALTGNSEKLKNLSTKKEQSGAIEMKADEDMNDSNFGTGALALVTTDRSRSSYEYPFAPLWLRNVLPNTSTSGSAIQYLRENGGTGAAEVWDGTGAIEALTNKPGTSSNFELITKTVEWIAGITRVKREMLDDIPWLQGYLSRQLTVGKRGLWVAENTQIYNALTDAANSVPYDGDKTIPVEMVYDAAFGQLRGNCYNPTTILMNHRDVVNLIAFNKASGSGEYDLPNGTVSIIGNQLMLGGVPVLGVPNIPAGEFVVFDKNATEFVSRMSPEIRFFEQDRDNVPKNLITVRAEERVAILVYDEDAIVTGSFAETT